MLGECHASTDREPKAGGNGILLMRNSPRYSASGARLPASRIACWIRSIRCLAWLPARTSAPSRDLIDQAAGIPSRVGTEARPRLVPASPNGWRRFCSPIAGTCSSRDRPARGSTCQRRCWGCGRFRWRSRCRLARLAPRVAGPRHTSARRSAEADRVTPASRACR